MKYVFATLTGLSLTAASALAQNPAALRPAKAVERQGGIMSIQAQLKAFARDDYKAAIVYQSADLRRNFASPDAFRTMMLRRYPEFAHYKAAQFGQAKADASGLHLAIPASVTGEDGITIHALYLLVRENKIYRIEGVQGGAQIPADIAPGVSGRDI